MRTNRSLIFGACLLLVAVSMAAEGDDAPPGEPDPVPGQLDIVEMTAVALDGRLSGDVQPAAFQWRIVEGEGGTLFAADQEDATFLAPKVERGIKEFVVELIVTYVDQPPSTRQLRIRVLPSDPALAEEVTDDGTPQWLIDKYARARKNEEEKKSNSPTVGGSGRNGSMSIGISGGSGGTRGGFRWSMSYPITQPVDVPPPGQTQMPGQGAWGAPQPVPYEELSTTFPLSVVERYQSPEPPGPESSETEPEQD